MNNYLYTWIDVQSRLEEYFSQVRNVAWLEDVSFRAYWDGLTISYSRKKREEEIIDKLTDIFGGAFVHKQTAASFLSMEGGETFPVYFEEVEPDEIDVLSVRPNLGLGPFVGKKEAFSTESPLHAHFFAFHSFKGGVGRTLHAIAFALYLAQEHKVLLIDADFEAPGISWLLAQSSISFSDFLAMVHGNSNHEKGIEIVAEKLKDNDEEQGNLFILPAYRGLNEDKIPTLEIKPEHIYNFSPEPFLLTDVIDQLAQKLHAKYVILDLRAGVSELSSGWFFDPRIQKVFTTTLSSQSLLGTAKMFDILARFNSQNQTHDTRLPFLIISQVSMAALESEKAIWRSPMELNPALNLLKLRKRFVKAFYDAPKTSDAAAREQSEEEIITNEIPPYTLFSAEKDSLKSLPDKWYEVAQRIKDSKLEQEMAKLQAILPDDRLENQQENWDENRKKLREAAKMLIFAEGNEQTDFLVTSAIENLMTEFKSRLPICVVAGAKGAGKTFLYKQIWKSKDWSDFLAKKFPSNRNSAFILPITIPQNQSYATESLYSNLYHVTQYTTKEDIWADYIRPAVQQNLKDTLTDTEWRERWLDYMAWAAGFKVSEPQVGRAFIDLLKDKQQKIVAIFDGLEELFADFHTNPQAKAAIRALTQDVPNLLEKQGDMHLGLIVFIRKDIISAAVTQNTGQLLSRYAKFELKWDAGEALRLIHWILITFNIFRNHSLHTNELKDKTFEELVPGLYKLWGMRMASDTSKEAYSHNWVLGALANLKKEIQSRDIVRFLGEAAELSMQVGEESSSQLYKNRLLYPTAIKKSIGQVGKEKINEIRSENLALKRIFEDLEKNTDIKFPCPPDIMKEVLPNEADISILEESGVVILHNGEYYMASIYQQSLGFEYSRKGTPKVLYF